VVAAKFAGMTMPPPATDMVEQIGIG
jgi:hypothetical protein